MTGNNANGWCPSEENDDTDPNPNTAINDAVLELSDQNEAESQQHSEIAEYIESHQVASSKALGPNKPVLTCPGNTFLRQSW